MVDKYNPENNSEEELGEEENSKTKASIFQVNAEISWKCPPPLCTHNVVFETLKT